MPNRVTFTQINDLVQGNIATNYQRLSRFQEQLSSGKRLQRPSDGPVDITNDLQFRSDLKKLEQFKRNIDDGVSYLSVVETTMSSTNDLFQRARELAIQASNDTNTDLERGFILNEVRVVLDSLVSISNQTFKGNFIFSGTNTKTPPYSLRSGADNIDDVFPLDPNNVSDTSLDTAALAGGAPQTIQLWDRTYTQNTSIANNLNGNAPVQNIIPGTMRISGLTEGTDYSVDYVNGTITFLPPGAAAIAAAGAGGIDMDYEWIMRSEEDLSGKIFREVETGIVGQINSTADEIFGSSTETTSWDAIIELMQGLHANSSTNIRSGIDQINVAFERSLQAQATAGARANRFDLTSDINDSSFIEVTRLHSNLEDVDFAKVISDFLLQESVYTASLQSGARVIQPTLANFL